MHQTEQESKQITEVIKQSNSITLQRMQVRLLMLISDNLNRIANALEKGVAK